MKCICFNCEHRAKDICMVTLMSCGLKCFSCIGNKECPDYSEIKEVEG